MPMRLPSEFLTKLHDFFLLHLPPLNIRILKIIVPNSAPPEGFSALPPSLIIKMWRLDLPRRTPV